MSALLDAVTYAAKDVPQIRVMRLDTLRAFLRFWKDVPAYALNGRSEQFVFGMNFPLVQMDARIWTQDPKQSLESFGTVLDLVTYMHPGLGDALEGEGPLPEKQTILFLNTVPLEALFAPNMNTVVRVSNFPFQSVNNPHTSYAGVLLYLPPSMGGEPLSSLSPWPASLPELPGALPTTTLPSIPSLPSVQLPGWLQPQASPAPAAPAAAPASEFPLWGKVAIGAVLAGAAWYLVKPKRYVANNEGDPGHMVYLKWSGYWKYFEDFKQAEEYAKESVLSYSGTLYYPEPRFDSVKIVASFDEDYGEKVWNVVGIRGDGVDYYDEWEGPSPSYIPQREWVGTIRKTRTPADW